MLIWLGFGLAISVVPLVRDDLVLVFQIGRLVVHGPLQLGHALLVRLGARASLLRLPQVKVPQRTPSRSHVLVERDVVARRELARLGVE